jgi:hypothetical protein
MTYTGREATPGTILTIISFCLLLIVNLITPIIKRLHFVKVSRKNTADELTIGLWGYCAQNSGEPKKCSPPKIGFAFGVYIFKYFLFECIMIYEYVPDSNEKLRC